MHALYRHQTTAHFDCETMPELVIIFERPIVWDCLKSSLKYKMHLKGGRGRVETGPSVYHQQCIFIHKIATSNLELI